MMSTEQALALIEQTYHTESRTNGAALRLTSGCIFIQTIVTPMWIHVTCSVIHDKSRN